VHVGNITVLQLMSLAAGALEAKQQGAPPRGGGGGACRALGVVGGGGPLGPGGAGGEAHPAPCHLLLLPA
jgi:hypothetical protein